MTDEERRKLCENLRSMEAEYADELIERLHKAGLKAADEIERELIERLHKAGLKAADEIERLATDNKRLKQAGPVAHDWHGSTFGR